eukprot:491848-Amphidinium_carterae.2
MSQANKLEREIRFLSPSLLGRGSHVTLAHDFRKLTQIYPNMISRVPRTETCGMLVPARSAQSFV